MFSKLTVTTALAALVLAALAATASGSVRYDGLTAGVEHQSAPSTASEAPGYSSLTAVLGESGSGDARPIADGSSPSGVSSPTAILGSQGVPNHSPSPTVTASDGDGFDWGYLAIAVAAALMLGLFAAKVGRQRSRGVRRPTPARMA